MVIPRWQGRVAQPEFTCLRSVPEPLFPRCVHSSAPTRLSAAAVQAEADGADYIFFGTVFPSRSHPGGPTSGVEGIAATVNAVSLPVIGIGGITAANCRSVIDAGAVGVAAIGAIIGEYDSYRATRALHGAMVGGRSHFKGGRAGGTAGR